MNKFDAIAKRQAGQVPGFVGADETLEEYEARAARDASPVDEALPAGGLAPVPGEPTDPAEGAPYWPSV